MPFLEMLNHVAAKKDAAVIGKLFGKFMYTYSSFESVREGFIFTIVKEKDISFVLLLLARYLVLAKKLSQLPGLSGWTGRLLG